MTTSASPTLASPDAAPVDRPACDAGRPDATGPDATGPDATGPDATGPDATGPDATGLDTPHIDTPCLDGAAGAGAGRSEECGTPSATGDGVGDAAGGAAAPQGRLVLVTGPSGAGRSTAIRALEDLGFEVIDNLPLSLLPRLVEAPHPRPLALGLDVRNRDWGGEGAGALCGLIDRLGHEGHEGAPGRRADRDRPVAEVLYLDCPPEVLLRRYSETRRRHPLAPDGAPEAGIARERALLAPVRARADVLIDTGALTVHELRARVEAFFGPEEGRAMAVTVESFSYRQGLPGGLDVVMDCRFLRNPHWDEGLRPRDGRDAAVAAFVEADPAYAPFVRRLSELILALLPAYRAEGKAHLGVGLGCTGGQHRSVAVAEALARALADGGWQVSKRHRELERRTFVPQRG